VRLYGNIYTMRDAGHGRALKHLRETGELPYALQGQALFYAGPTEPAANRPFGAIGPTTASRMDFATPELLQAGINLTLGKGPRSAAVRQACRQTGSVYLAATGGAAALLASYVSASELVAWDDLGTEALRRLTLTGLPAIVAIDSRGNDIYQQSDSYQQAESYQPEDRVQQPENQQLALAMGETTTGTTPSAKTPNPNAPGIFITFEGGEGTGKSTQILLLKARLEAANYQVLTLREPGSTRIGEQIRAILLNPANTSLDSHAELLLYQAARAQLVHEIIRPALAQGSVVLCDRFTDSTTAYQGAARGLAANYVNLTNTIGADGLVPNRTIILARDAGESLSKATLKGPDRLEAEGLDFHLRVHQGFAALAKAEPRRVKTVAVSQSKTATAQAVFACLHDLFPAAALDFQISDDLLAQIKEQRG
jgi:dTMP kinase